MLQAILFDLDNTLILFDESEFYAHYMPKLARWFDDLIPPDQFAGHLLRAVHALADSTGDQLNVDLFLSRFATGLAIDGKRLWPRFLDFYQHAYDQLKPRVGRPAGLADVWRQVCRRPYKRVLASNPLFPLAVQATRLKWGGLDADQFDWVTHIENMRFCKPNPGYYLQICEQIGVAPSHCLMIGNDSVYDLAAAQAGMKTYLTTDARPADSVTLSADANATYQMPTPDFTGPLADAPKAIAALDPDF